MGEQPFDLEDEPEGFTGRLEGRIFDGRIVYVTDDGRVVAYDEGTLSQFDPRVPQLDLIEALPKD